MRHLLIICCLIISQQINAQAILPVFGELSPEEKSLTECSFDKNAGAIVLLDEAVATHDDSYHLITRRRTRIKIFSQRELDRANIRIPFYSKDKFEFIRNIRGIVYNDEGNKPVVTILNNRSVFTEKEDAFYSSVKFALPNVKPGSIIEYEYESFKEHYGGLKSWEFQNELPTLKSCFLVTLLPNTDFHYSVQKKPHYPIYIKPFPETGKIYYEMSNLPGLKFEPYMDAVNDYLQKVIFQLEGYIDRYGQKVNVSQTWKQLAIDLIDDKDFGGALKKGLSKIDDLKNSISGTTSDSAKLVAIYDFIRNNFEWNGYHSKYTVQGLKTTWEKRTGTSADINLLLINLLENFNIEVYPLLVAERDFGKIDTTYPFVDRFNKVTAFALVGGRSFILDATQKYSPAGLTPYSLLNTIGFIVDKKDPMLVRIASSMSSFRNQILVEATVDTKGTLAGTAVISSDGYARQLRTEKVKSDKEKFVSEMIRDAGSEMVIDNCDIDNLGDESKPLVQRVKFHNELNTSGGFVFVPYNLFLGLGKNPFTATERFTNVNFGYPYDLNLKVTIQLPEKNKVDKLPGDKTITSPDRQITASRKLRIEKNILTANIEFKQTITLVSAEKYEQLKTFYKEIIDLLNDPVIVKIED